MKIMKKKKIKMEIIRIIYLILLFIYLLFEKLKKKFIIFFSKKLIKNDKIINKIKIINYILIKIENIF